MNPKIKKKVYTILIAVLTLCVLYFVNAFTGNPISNMLAKSAAQQYIETVYPVSWADALSISDFPAKRMREENLPQVMEKFETQRVAALDLPDKRVSDNGTA